MDPKPDYDECVQIETARCEVRKQCEDAEGFKDSYKRFNVDTCIAYSKEHCSTRKIRGTDWDQGNVEACVEAILSLKYDCSRLIPKGIDETESIGQCNFIDNGDAGLIDLIPKEGTESDDDGSPDTENGTDTTDRDAGA